MKTTVQQLLVDRGMWPTVKGPRLGVRKVDPLRDAARIARMAADVSACSGVSYLSAQGAIMSALRGMGEE